ncbi:phage antirepressor KilAC domain-containing protein [Porcipelethomonas ammoniilytica]|uniref:phage antirepressor KilAC domain-containing protein n=1 Tax=Porcipelethomonas ammoniilytica TaxID=2981722 RepID=UPI0008218C60|nr:phage antirepressor KilAC domain-containing protein [Porcipelethomonas ammoniilytica]MCU6720702.1 phage antirepressor KilAC domain-containing protein [Porcipelethomonas ammoniilytica]SCJ22212.1 Phage anti-repressor protein [uncultured Ruminococcus sp.]
MNELIKINYEDNADRPTVLGRELHEVLGIKTKYVDWFNRMCEYGFTENTDFILVAQKRETNNPKNPYTVVNDHQLTIEMAKEICMIQRTDKGKQCRQYFLELEKAWNTPEMVMGRALKIAQNQLDSLKGENLKLTEKIKEDKPKVLFADAVETAHTSILVGDLAKLIKQNGVDIGQKRLFEYLRENGYLIKNGSSKNMPTQKSMDMKLFEVKERTINNPDGTVRITKTTKVTGKGQTYFINKFLGETKSA